MNSKLNKKQFNTILGKKLRDFRLELGLSQEQFALAAELGRSHYGSIERGEKSVTTYNLYRLLEANHIPIGSFFEQI